MIYDFEGHTPKMDPQSWAAPNSVLIGRVELKKDSNVWFNATLRGDIDYATAEAETTYGICGIKVWINKGEILSKDPYASEKKQIDQGSVR